MGPELAPRRINFRSKFGDQHNPDFVSPSWGWGTPGAVFVVALVSTALAVLPVLVARHLPLLDGPGHEAGLAALRDLLFTHKGSPFYALSSFFLPDIAFDLVGSELIRIFTPETVGKIFFAFTQVLTLWGVLALNRVAIGRWSMLPIASVLLLFNLISILGFFSFSFGLALVPWALAARLTLERSSRIAAFLIGSSLAVILLFCHVSDFGIYAVMSSGFALAALAQRRISIGLFCLRSLEPVPAMALFLKMSTARGSHIVYEHPFVWGKLLELAKSMTSGSIEGDIAFVIGAVSLVLLMALYSRPRLAPSFVPGLIVLCLLFFILPAKLASGSYVDVRLPVAILLLGMAGLDARIRRGTVSAILIALIAIAAMFKQGALAVQWRSFDPLINTIAATLDRLPTSSVIMEAECEPEFSDVLGVYRERQPSMTHLAAMASFDDTRFVASTWAIAGQQTIQVTHPYQPYYDLQNSFGVSCATSAYRAELASIEGLAKAQQSAKLPVPPLYFMLIRPPTPETLSDSADLIAQDRRFELYAIRNKSGSG